MPPPPALPAGSGRDAWAVAIGGADKEWLVELFALRPDLALAAPKDLEVLVELLISPGSVAEFYDLADRTTRQVLDALCVLASPTDLEALAAALGGAPAVVGRVVERLAAAALLLPGDPGPGLMRNPGLSRAVPHPAGLAGSARDMLSRYPVRDLSEMADRIGAGAKGAKAVVLDSLAHGLSSPERMAGVVAAGPAGTGDLAYRLAAEPLEVTLTWGMYETGRSDRTPAGWLLRRGLLVPTAWGSAMMPAEVALALRGGRLFESFAGDGPELAITTVDQGWVDRQAAEAALRVVSDVTAVLEAWAGEPAKVLRSGGLGVREVRRAAKLIGRAEPDAARLFELMACAGLAAVDGETEDGQIVLPTAGYDRWSDLEVAARWAELADAWRTAPVHLSLAGALDAKGKPIPPLLDRPPEMGGLIRRRVMLSLLSELPEGDALEPAGAAAVADWRMPALWQGGPATSPELVSWVLEEADLLGVSNSGTLSSFGRRVAAGDPGAAEALAPFSPPATSEVVLQADLTAVVAGELAPDLRRELDLLADVESAGAATVYRFSETSLRRGFDAGRSAEELLAWLEDHGPKGVPQPLRYLVDDLARRFGRARVGHAASYLRSDDPALVAEVVRAKKTARLHLRLLAPTVAVSDVDQDTTVRILREGGYLAAPEGADGALTLTRPSSRRAAPRAEPDEASLEEDLVQEMLADPEMLAAFVGLPSSALPPGVLAGAQRLREEADGPARGPAPLAPPRPLHRGLPRPTQITRGVTSIAELLGLAAEQDWTVRLSYGKGPGQDVELYVEVISVDRRAARLQCHPDGTVQTIALPTIEWARVATAAEEAALPG